MLELFLFYSRVRTPQRRCLWLHVSFVSRCFFVFSAFAVFLLNSALLAPSWFAFYFVLAFLFVYLFVGAFEYWRVNFTAFQFVWFVVGFVVVLFESLRFKLGLFFMLFVVLFSFFICAVALSPSLSVSLTPTGGVKILVFSVLCVFLCKANETKTKKSPKNLKSFCFDFFLLSYVVVVFYFCCNFQLFAIYICMYYFLIRFRWWFFYFFIIFVVVFLYYYYFFRLWWKWCQNGVLVTKAVEWEKEKGGND